MIVLWLRNVDLEASVETFACTEILFRNLMADRTSHAVFGAGVLLGIGIEGEMRKDLAQLAVLLGLVTRNGHVAIGAAIFDFSLRFRMFHVFAPHTGLPVGIARGIPHDARAPLETD